MFQSEDNLQIDLEWSKGDDEDSLQVTTLSSLLNRPDPEISNLEAQKRLVESLGGSLAV